MIVYEIRLLGGVLLQGNETSRQISPGSHSGKCSAPETVKSLFLSPRGKCCIMYWKIQSVSLHIIQIMKQMERLVWKTLKIFRDYREKGDLCYTQTCLYCKWVMCQNSCSSVSVEFPVIQPLGPYRRWFTESSKITVFCLSLVGFIFKYAQIK